MSTNHTPTQFPTGLMLDRGQIVGPMGDFYGQLSECNVAFAHELIERANAHDELVEFAKYVLELDPKSDAPMFARARAALAKVQQA